MIPEIAIVEQNTLTALGLQTIIEELLPKAIIRVFPSFERLVDDTPDMYAHYFVSAQIYFAHTVFFLERKTKTIVLSGGEQPTLNGIHTLNIHLPQDKLVKASWLYARRAMMALSVRHRLIRNTIRSTTCRRVR